LLQFHCAVLLFASQTWATRPHLANIFKKLLDQKTFVCLRLIVGNVSRETIFLKNHLRMIRQG